MCSEQLYLQLVAMKLRGLDTSPAPYERITYWKLKLQYKEAVVQEKRNEVLRDRADRKRLRNKWRLLQSQQAENACAIKTS